MALYDTLTDWWESAGNWLTESVGNTVGRVFGSRTSHILRELAPRVEAINRLEPQYEQYTDAELREMTDKFRRELYALRDRDPRCFDNGRMEALLDGLLHDAFALVREASKRTLGMRHYDVQLIGGMVLHHNSIAEMVTGEGKTLVATLPSYLNALVRREGEYAAVHVVTVNDYLARRDAEWNRPLFELLGLTVGAIQAEMLSDERHRIYSRDITYGTNSEFGFDYLRDHMKYDVADQVQRWRHFAIVDEVDSILIDEARTPLIISGGTERDSGKYYQACNLARSLQRIDDDLAHLYKKAMLAQSSQAGIRWSLPHQEAYTVEELRKAFGFDKVSSVRALINAGKLRAGVDEAGTVHFEALCFDHEDRPIAAEVVWSVSGGGEINEEGRFAASREGGPFQVQARHGGGIAEAAVSVLPPGARITHLQLAAEKRQVPRGGQLQLSAVGTDERGKKHHLSPQRWEADGGGTVDRYGRFQAEEPGTWKVRGVFGEAAGELEIEVYEPRVSKLVVKTKFERDPPYYVGRGGQLEFVAEGHDQHGRPLPVDGISWSASGGGEMDGWGVFTARQVGGPYRITAKAGAAEGIAELTVQPAPPVLEGLHLAPERCTVEVGREKPLQATPLDQFGNPYLAPVRFKLAALAQKEDIPEDLQELDWEEKPPEDEAAAATLSAAGVFLARHTGKFEVAAQCEEYTASALVEAVEPTVHRLEVFPAASCVILPSDERISAEAVREFTEKIVADAEYVTRGVGHYIVNRKDRTIELTEAGMDACQRILRIGNIHTGRYMDWPHLIDNALKAKELYERDVEYVVERGESERMEVIIVDEFTGRKMHGRRWSDGLHQAVEAKEGLEIEGETQTLATITIQNFFKLYRKLAGMTGTALTEAREFGKVYKLEVAAIPTNRPLRRYQFPDVIYGTEKEKWEAICEEIERHHGAGRPVLVGTTSVEKSEKLAKMLERRGFRPRVDFEVLNAKQHEREAHIVARAGQLGAITVATNMAGRGTDILLGEFDQRELLRHWQASELAPKQLDFRQPREKLEGALYGFWSKKFLDQSARDKLRPEQYRPAVTKFLGERGWPVPRLCSSVRELGGLHIVGTERHEARRIDYQLRGRSGRQGDPGSSRFFLSLDDDLMKIFARDWVKNFLRRSGMRDGVPLESRMVSRAIEKAQRRVEERNFGIRKSLVEYDEVMNEQRKIVYGLRQQVLEARDLKETMLRWIGEVIAEKVDQVLEETIPSPAELVAFVDRCMEMFGPVEYQELQPEEMLTDEDRRAERERRRTAGSEGFNYEGLADFARRRHGLALAGETLRQWDEQGVLRDEVASALRQHYDAMDVPGEQAGKLAAWFEERFAIVLPTAELRGQSRHELHQVLLRRAHEVYAERERELGFTRDIPRSARERLVNLMFKHLNPHLPREEWSIDGLCRDIATYLRVSITPEAVLECFEHEQVARRLEQLVFDQLETKSVAKMRMIERYLMLRLIDTKWKDHLYEMDVLKEGIHLEGLAQKDPKVQYRVRGNEMFRRMQASLKDEATNLIMKLAFDPEIESQEMEDVYGEGIARHEEAQSTLVSEAEMRRAAEQGGAEIAAVTTIRDTGPKIGPNDPCPCGSGRKYKKCHGHPGGPPREVVEKGFRLPSKLRH